MSRYDNHIIDERFYNVFSDSEDEINDFFQDIEYDCNCQNERSLHSCCEAAKNLYFSKGYVQGVVNDKEDQELLGKRDWRLCFPMACPCPRKSEEAFLKGLPSDIGAVGPQGQIGEKGDKGEKGEKGEKGDTGMQGEQGPQGERGKEGPRGAAGRAGIRGPKGDSIADYLTANAIAAQSIEEEGAIVYGENTSLGGTGIEHAGNTSEFILAPEHTYYMTLSVSGNSSKQCPFYFSIKLCDEVIGAVHSTIAKGYNGASAYLCFKTPAGIPGVLRIINACGEEVNSINSSIGIMQFA